MTQSASAVVDSELLEDQANTEVEGFGSAPGPQSAEEHEYPAVDLHSPQFTVRAIITGMLLGGVLSLCNIYAGLKIGWGFNMSITAALLSFGFWKGCERALKTRPLGMLENNINQTTASSAASISSAGLVAPIPALTMLTGQHLSWTVLAVWTFAVSLVGVMVAIGLRRQMLLVDKLAFPSGVATGETIKEMYAKGSEAMARVKVLVAGGLFGAAAKLAIKFASIPKLTLPGTMSVTSGSALSKGGFSIITMKNLGFAVDPSPLMAAVGALIGIRACISLMLGAAVAWGVLAPYALEMGWAAPGTNEAGAMWFGTLNKWMLWPGVAMMVTASLTSFAFSWRSIANAIFGGMSRSKQSQGATPVAATSHDVPRKMFLIGMGVALVLASVTQVTFFGIALWVAVLGVLLTFLLAVVAARVSGETGITPVGPMGKVTQLMFGVIAPGSATPNLMAANVTAGAASQCADLLHDMKTGLLIGASPRLQAAAQFFGIAAGATVGSAGYLLLVPDPATMLLTEEWPAPAVAAWKAVAEIFAVGLEKMPARSMEAIAIAGVIGIVLAILEKQVKAEHVKWVPSPASIGLAMVIPAFYSISMFLGGVIAWAMHGWATSWSKRFLIVAAAGIIAGESLAGVSLAISSAMDAIGG